VFARSGYRATPVTEVASAAGVSQAYVFRLFDDKLHLFLAALEHCHEQILATLSEVADRMSGEGLSGPSTSSSSEPAPRTARCSSSWPTGSSAT
jgi:AcrR family transcriptional regulator